MKQLLTIALLVASMMLPQSLTAKAFSNETLNYEIV